MVARFDLELRRWFLGYWQGSTFVILASYPG